jgi:site-specific DNA-cytosine methylase
MIGHTLMPARSLMSARSACGRFIHPTEDRGITLRESAVLRTFPATYKFSRHYGVIERQIGNAVPVQMAKAFGLVVAAMLKEFADAVGLCGVTGMAPSEGLSVDRDVDRH